MASEPSDSVGTARPGGADLRDALRTLRQATGLPLAFAGLVEPGPGQLRISELQGNRTTALQGLAVHSGNGLGGKTVALARPCWVTDYSLSRQISHEYDAAVAAEGIRSVLAVPVVVRRQVRGVLYGALRAAQPLGDRTVGAALDAARDLEQSLVVRDEARNLLATARAGTAHGNSAGAWEEVREAHGALRALAPRIDDPGLRAELLRVCGRLAGASASGEDAAGPAAPVRDGGERVALTAREVDVLACVAMGATNAVAAQRLGLRPETVKAYLRSAMRKLGAHTRLEAVVAARRAGLLP
ncbi:MULTISPECIES: response regulator transcription factor [Streptomyces]|uniref:Putative response regulator n=9 Tax=Streptomyces scabiei TaxID=1930 RepID=C9ZGM0_STRSW|nr:MULTISPECIES: helix-turn-helix transcriptional regulator [Streptomyces]MBP5860276.1 GAF domain-containing protein [Streptomyces sp. LBUM 1484]KFG09342.1 response regulator [Streptomyces scabiei]MBP5879375.1 GAF domain-containing protein [Streptomyces sp. LBUM 1477]MBP5887202.1 GAF domain-containing protein [Streptomyces sp. LBUM 1487]MBP5890214.1 GAF domain-containing protein [Streptomyces sp. LBUM 1481]